MTLQHFHIVDGIIEYYICKVEVSVLVKMKVLAADMHAGI